MAASSIRRSPLDGANVEAVRDEMKYLGGSWDAARTVRLVTEWFGVTTYAAHVARLVMLDDSQHLTGNGCAWCNEAADDDTAKGGN